MDKKKIENVGQIIEERGFDKELDFKLVLLEHLNRISQVSAIVDSDGDSSLYTFNKMVLVLENLLAPYIDEEYRKEIAEQEAEKEEKGSKGLAFHRGRARFDSLIRQMGRMNILLPVRGRLVV